MEQRFIAQDQVEEHPGRRGADDHCAEYGSMQVAENFFERKENRGDGRIESCGECGGATHGHQVANGGGAQAEAASKHGSDSRADLDGGSFASQRDAAGKRNGTTEKFSDDGFERDVAVVDEDGEFGLRNAAATRVGEIAVEKIAGDERTRGGDQDAAPSSAPGGYMRAASRPVRRMKATTTSPTSAPITKLRRMEMRSSRSGRRRVQSRALSII